MTIRITIQRGAFYRYIDVSSDERNFKKIHFETPMPTCSNWREAIGLAAAYVDHYGGGVIELDWGDVR